MAPEFSPLYRDLTYLSPLSSGRADELCRFIAREAGGSVLDVGCGWAGLLIDMVAAKPELLGVGIDQNADSIAEGRRAAERRGVSDRLDLVVGDVKENLPSEAGAVVCIGSSQIWGPTVEANQPIDYRSALVAIRQLLNPGSPVVFGEGIWTAEPTPEAVAPLAGRMDEFAFMPDLLDVARQSGFQVLRTHEASLDEWDQFESGFTAGYVRWLAENGEDHTEHESVVARLQAQTDAYFRGYRGILGMAYLQLIAV